MCSCPDWDKNLICKHVIGVAYRLDLCEFPGLDLNIEANKKRGRRKQATPALIQRTSTGPINPALQSFSYEFPISMGQSINQDNNGQDENNDNDTEPNIGPRKRGRPRKNP